MTLTGGCYCGDLRYEAGGDPVLKAQCHCRECQYFSGGGPNFFITLPEGEFAYTAGVATLFARTDLDNPVMREFCPDCGTHIVTRLPGRDLIVLKVGTLDDPSAFDPKIAIYAVDRQPFHLMADGLPVFERMPPAR